MSWYALAVAGGVCEALLLESDRAVLCVGERGEASCAPELYSAPLRSLEEGGGESASWLDPSTTSPRTPAAATARSPCLPSETCTSFQANDTIWYASGTIEEDNVFTWSSPQKAISIAFFFIKHNNDEVMERLYCSRAKTHYSCQTSEYKRNYKMAFCTRSAPIACLGDWGRGGKGREGELICVNFSSESQTGGKGLTTTQNAFCVRGVWLPAGILMVSQCTAAVKMMPSTPDSFGKQFLPYHCGHKDCEWTYFSNCRLITAGHMLPKLLKTISVGSYYHVQMDFRRPGEN